MIKALQPIQIFPFYTFLISSNNFLALIIQSVTSHLRKIVMITLRYALRATQRPRKSVLSEKTNHQSEYSLNEHRDLQR